MDYILSTLLSYLLIYKYFAVFVLIFVSGLLLPIPTNTLLLASGAFASQGFMDPIAVFFTGLVANVMGDSVGYALTRIWGTKIITKERIRRYKVTAWVETFVSKHTRLTIAATRFLGTPAVVVNFLCGLISTPYSRFLLYDAIGNTLDISFFIFAGYVLGYYSENFSDIAQLGGWIVFVLFLLAILAKFVWSKRKEHKG